MLYTIYYILYTIYYILYYTILYDCGGLPQDSALEHSFDDPSVHPFHPRARVESPLKSLTLPGGLRSGATCPLETRAGQLLDGDVLKGIGCAHSHSAEGPKGRGWSEASCRHDKSTNK